MVNRFLLAALLLGGALVLFPAIARAQDPDPAAQVFSALVGAGFDVLEVGYYPDAQGNPAKNSVYAQMATAGTDLGDPYILRQTLSGFAALAKYFPGAGNLIVVLKYERWLYFFVTTAPEWEDVVAKRVRTADFWNTVRAQARIYDTVEKKYITAKDFTTQNQTDKNQTAKDFSGQDKSPLPPVNINPDAEAENILLEPSTTYLPADGKAEGFLLATLTDRDLAGIPGRGVNFVFEARGQDEKSLGATLTDQFGTARAKITSSRPLDLVLLRAATASLNASTQILVGAAPGDDTQKQIQAVIAGLTNQGYREADADYSAYAGPAGNTIRLGIAAVRVTTDSFDREVYSQLARMIGTMRTVMSDANYLRPVLLYAANDGHDYALLFSLRTDIWDAYVRGDIGANQFWAMLSYDGAINENGVRTDEKDFLSKNFSRTQTTRYSSAAREIISSLTNEGWGEQLTVGSFLVPVGGFADSFHVAELSGGATGFAVYSTPNYSQPEFTFRRGEEAALSALRLEAGQYIVAVSGTTAPAQLQLQFIEHLTR